MISGYYFCLYVKIQPYAALNYSLFAPILNHLEFISVRAQHPNILSPSFGITLSSAENCEFIWAVWVQNVHSVLYRHPDFLCNSSDLSGIGSESSTVSSCIYKQCHLTLIAVCCLIWITVITSKVSFKSFYPMLPCFPQTQSVAMRVKWLDFQLWSFILSHFRCLYSQCLILRCYISIYCYISNV